MTPQRIAILVGGLVAFAPIVAKADCKYVPLTQLPIHFENNSTVPLIDGAINGRSARFMFSTGTWATSLTMGAVARYHLPVFKTKEKLIGPTGESTLSLAEVGELSVGPSTGKNLRVPVLEANREIDGIVGADFALQADIEIDLANQAIKFYRASDCKDTWLAYWDKDAMEARLRHSSSDRRPYVVVNINSRPTVAMLSVAAAHSYIYSDVLRRIGAQQNDAAGNVRVEFQMGDETVKNANFAVVNHGETSKTPTEEMVLGQDWLKAHRVLLSPSQNKIYYTYIGGDLFQ